MSLRDNKMAVLRQLGLEFEPISLSELMLRLGKGFRERSVRRWLCLLVEEGTVKKIGQKRGTIVELVENFTNRALDFV